MRRTDALTQWKKLAPEVQQDLLVWSGWSEKEWAASLISEIEEGTYDKFLAAIVRAANERMSSVFKVPAVMNGEKEKFSSDDKTNAEVAGAVVSRIDGMKHAAQIVKDLGLTIEVPTTRKRKSKSGKVVEVKDSMTKTMPVTRENYGEIITEHGEAHKKFVVKQQQAAAKAALVAAKKRAEAAEEAERKSKIEARKASAKKVTTKRAPVKKAVAKKAVAPRKRVSK